MRKTRHFRTVKKMAMAGVLLSMVVILSACAFPGLAKPTLTPTLEPSYTPTVTNTPEPSATPTLAETPTPTLTATPTIQYAITLGTLFDKHCNLIFAGDHLVVDPGCTDIKLDKFPIKRGEQVWFAIFLVDDTKTFNLADSSGWIKLQPSMLSQVDARGLLFSCSPPDFGDFICIVNIESQIGLLPVHLNITAALE